MTPELEKKLVEDFPLLYSDTNKPPQESLMCFGFECRDGWYHIIRSLSRRLEECIEDYNNKNLSTTNPPRAMQVKEKFGSLRFYMTHATDDMFTIIEAYELISEDVCEECGMTGAKIEGPGWLRALCPSCRGNCDEIRKNRWKTQEQTLQTSSPQSSTI